MCHPTYHTTPPYYEARKAGNGSLDGWDDDDDDDDGGGGADDGDPAWHSLVL